MTPSNSPTWKSLILSLTADAKFSPSAELGQIEAIEHGLQATLPNELRDLLAELDGFTADHGADVVWSARDILERNHEFRSTEEFRDLYMPFDNLLFFGDDGGGDQFAYSIHADGIIHKRDIFRWEHETDARSWFASGLRQFFERRFPK